MRVRSLDQPDKLRVAAALGAEGPNNQFICDDKPDHSEATERRMQRPWGSWLDMVDGAAEPHYRIGKSNRNRAAIA